MTKKQLELKILLNISLERDGYFNMPKSAFTDFLSKYIDNADDTETLDRIFLRNNLSFEKMAKDIKEEILEWDMRFSSFPKLKDEYLALGWRLYEYCERFGYHPDFDNRITNTASFKANFKPLIERIDNVLPWTISAEHVAATRIEVEFVFIQEKLITTKEGLKFYNDKEKIKEHLIKAVKNDKEIREQYDDSFADKILEGTLDVNNKNLNVYEIPYFKLKAYNKEVEKYI